MDEWMKSIGGEFVATDPRWPTRFPDPVDFMKFMWSAMGEHTDVPDLQTACFLAGCGGKYYKALKAWALEHGDDLPESGQAMVFRALNRKPPSAAKYKHDHRNRKLHQISHVLRSEYGMTKASLPALLKMHLVWHIEEATIADIID